MELLLIRHGTTAGNVTHRHQPDNGRLTAQGRAEAANAANYVQELKPTHFISSTHVRTLETAAIICRITNSIPSTSALFTELHRPRYMYGQFHRSLSTVRYLLGWFIGLIGSDVDIGKKGESYRVFQNRVAHAARELKEFPVEARVVVVSHSVFIAFLVHHLTRGHRVWLWQAPFLLRHIFTIKNGSATHLRYDARTSRWQKVAYMDGATTVMK